MTEITSLIQNHRSIRKYKDMQISDDILQDLFLSAQSASSSHNVQAYSIILVRDQEKKDKISMLAGDQRWVRECPVFLVFCADLYKMKTACEMNDAPYALNGIENLIVGIVDTALAAQTLLISAESYGLGGVYIGGIRNDVNSVSEVLKLPEYVIPIAGMCLGYPDDNPGKKPRQPLSIVVHEDHYREEEIVPGLLDYDDTMSEYYSERTNGEKEAGWTELMAEYLATERRLDLKEFIINKGIKII